MAQNSDALQEPSMDELLASIREIIEENTGIPPQEGQGRASPQGGNARFAPNESAAARQRGGYDAAAMPPIRQDIRVRNDKNGAPPRGQQNAAPQHSDGGFYPAQNNGAGQNAPQGFRNFGAELARWDGQAPGINAAAQQDGFSRQSAPVPPPQSRRSPGGGSADNAGRQAREPYFAPRAGQGQEHHNQAGQNGHAPSESRPVQDSMNALAERIGLRRAAGGFSAQQPQEAPRAPVPPGNHNFAYAAAGNGGGNPAQAGQNRSAPGRNGNFSRQDAGGYKETAPQAKSGEEARPRFNPAALAAHYQGGDDKMPAAFEAKEAGRQAYPAPPQARARAEYHEDGGDADFAARAERAVRGEPLRQEAVKPAEFNKAFPADVEHSAENLLRPFITEWLNEHFRGLFEKILREEVQRFIQSARRDA